MPTPTADLVADLTFAELDQLAKLVAERQLELRTTGLETLRAEWERQAAVIGLAVSDVLRVAKRRKRRRVRDEAVPPLTPDDTRVPHARNGTTGE